MKKKQFFIIIIITLLVFLYGCQKDNDKIKEYIDQNKYNLDEILNKEIIIENSSNSDILYQEEVLYTNKKEGFTIKVPDGRNIQENKQIGRVLLSSPLEKGDKINENIIINTDSTQEKKTVDEYYTWQKQGIENHIQEYKKISKENINIAKVNGIKIIYQGNLGNYQLKRQQVIFRYNEKFFLITYTATQETFEKYIDQVNQIIESFNF